MILSLSCNFTFRISVLHIWPLKGCNHDFVEMFRNVCFQLTKYKMHYLGKDFRLNLDMNLMHFYPKFRRHHNFPSSSPSSPPPTHTHTLNQASPIFYSILLPFATSNLFPKKKQQLKRHFSPEDIQMVYYYYFLLTFC